jgi:LPXTG-motif cell wall-anchored protein
MKKTILRTLLILQTALVLLFPAYAGAQTYGQGPYSCGTFSNGNGTAACTGASTSSSGALSNTGQNVLLFSSIGAVVVGAGIIIILYKRRK